MINFDIFHKNVLGCCAALLPFMSCHAALAGQVKVLYAFKGGNDGVSPGTGVIKDKAGNLYGTTLGGGGGSCNDGCGTVFKLAPDGVETVLYAFKGGSDGYLPEGLARDSSGILYGTTQAGGDPNCGSVGCGTVFKLTPDGTKTVLYTFNGGNDGAYPYAGLLRDQAGNLYGTTQNGGGAENAGMVYAIAPDGTETILHAFCSVANCADGAYPEAGLIADKAGNLYGTTSGGGTGGGGVVFKVTKNETEKVLYSFCSQDNCIDGSEPFAPVVLDKAGNLYGTTLTGGQNFVGDGTLFKLAADGTETVLHSFELGMDGAKPNAGVTIDKDGNLYGTLDEYAGQFCQVNGIVYKLAPDGSEKLYCLPGDHPSGLVKGAGVLYGTGNRGGAYPNGLIYEIENQ
jgi:uncharacterized repeat protein (TIGR03803 family)